MIEIDARGLSCPEPMMMARNALKTSNGDAVRVLVSSATSRDNVMNLAKRSKRTAEVEQLGQDFAVVIR